VDPESAPGPQPSTLAIPARKPAVALDQHFVASALRNPLRAIDLCLAEPDRVGANVVAGVALGRIALVFLITSFVYAIPYGMVLSLASWWKIVALSLGSTLICLPSLFVFSSYLGQRMRLEQILVLGLTSPSVAALFSLGYAPILAFLRTTMSDDDTQVPWRSTWRLSPSPEASLCCAKRARFSRSTALNLCVHAGSRRPGSRCPWASAAKRPFSCGRSSVSRRRAATRRRSL
jgi:hypothetical protein